jgi:hypothetical protein
MLCVTGTRIRLTPTAFNNDLLETGLFWALLRFQRDLAIATLLVCTARLQRC